MSDLRFSDIFWIDASSESTIDLRLRQIARENNGPPKAVSSAASALRWISEKSNWLVVYDNADGRYQIVEKFLPPGNRGNILITSRNLELVRVTENSLEVLNMGEEEALSLLSKSARLQDTSENLQVLAKQLLSKLGGIPLAIDQAGAYMMACSCPLEDYLELYGKNLSNSSFKGASNYGSSTYGTWDMSMKEIEARAAKGRDSEVNTAKYAITLFKIIAFLHHENIPEELFKNAAENYKKRDIESEMEFGLPLSVTMLDYNVLSLDKRGEWDKMQFQLGMEILMSFSLIKKNGTMYSTHPLVNSWNRERIAETEINRQISMTKAMLACSVDLNYEIDNYKFCGLLAPHIRIMFCHAAQLNLGDVHHIDECDRFALVFHHVGNWNEEEKLVIQIIKMREEKLGIHHPDTLTSMAQLASTYWNQGRWDEAEKLGVQVMESMKEVFGSHHPDTLSSMGILVSTYRDQGRWDEAEKLGVQVMEAMKGKLGSHHPNTLKSMGHLAIIYRNQGRWDEAEKLGVYVIEATKEKLGPYHPDTFLNMAHLAITYQNQGRWDEAEKLGVQVMEAMKGKLASHHPDTLSTMGFLASMYQNQGRWYEAEKLQVQVMEARKEVLGSHHPETFISMNNIAGTYQNQGKWDEAEKLGVEVMEAMKAKLGSHHPNTLSGMSNLAVTYQYQGRWDEAEKLHIQVIDAMKEVLGSHHPDTLTSMANLAVMYLGQGQSSEADALLSQTVKLMGQIMGFQHPTTSHFSKILSQLKLLRKQQ